jgi:regulator of replication initiation timing
MKEWPTNPSDEILSGLKQLFIECGREDQSLLKQVEELIVENERLKLEIAKLRRIPSLQGSSIMSTKLRDALRE